MFRSKRIIFHVPLKRALIANVSNGVLAQCSMSTSSGSTIKVLQWYKERVRHVRQNALLVSILLLGKLSCVQGHVRLARKVH
eukprot:scaffold346_cov347-Pavlova_lutheri.AAC.30